MNQNTQHTITLKPLDSYDWSAINQDLDKQGYAILENLLRAEDCQTIAAFYDSDSLFRSRIIMAKHGFGRGEYQYFNYPLPDIVSILRTALYAKLLETANRWQANMSLNVRFSEKYGDFINQCHQVGQCKPTPLLVKYGADDYNCLHQDLYGEQFFPLQVAILLSQPEKDFTGGELVLTEQRPRMQSRVETVPLKQGDAVIFAVHQRPVKGKRGYYRVNMRHGVSRIRSGLRLVLGIIFHDAS